MAKEDIVKAWLDHVHEDIGAAECMLGGGYLLYVAFLCHQAVEKALKAYYAAYNDDEPPYTHSHIRLLDVCGLTGDISAEHLKFLTLMGPMYIKARYPEQKAKTARTLTKDGCQQMIETTKTTDAMDRRTLTRDEALDAVRRYKRVIRHRYHTEPKVILYGSYAKGYANPDSDIDVAVIVPEPEITDHWEQSANLWGDVLKVSTLIEPVLMEDNEDSMLYREVMRTGITV